ncbi:MAG: class I SAM-dependent methyltransferase, partial [Candidatus Ryanbacteria bacterium]|nr:class I SAM-dependent methyltransferase [Candidatus Ryanbacteria bacterium]
MQIIRDTFLGVIESVVSLNGKHILEIGCGDGTRSAMIAERCRYLVALEPSQELVEKASRTNSRANITYLQASALSLPFKPTPRFDNSFDVVIFTLSLHHIRPEFMRQAIQEATSVVDGLAYVIFFEPGFDGAFFDAEVIFDACDGDERKAKLLAYQAILDCHDLDPIAELSAETTFQFDSVEDFINTMHPKRELDKLETFLSQHNYQLRATR